MRVIVNLESDRLAKAAGWRAKAIVLNEKKEALLTEALKAVTLSQGSLYDFISLQGILRNEFVLYVNGKQVKGGSGLNIPVKDNTQVHIYER